MNTAADDYLTKLGMDNGKELDLEDDIILSRVVLSEVSGNVDSERNGIEMKGIKMAPETPLNRRVGRAIGGPQTIKDYIYYYLS